MKRFVCFAFVATSLNAQAPNAQMSALEVTQACTRLAELMDAGGVAIPDLRRPSEPIIDNVKQACAQLQSRAGAGQPTFAVLNNLRAFLDVADAVPKPYPLPDIARDQLREIRDASVRSKRTSGRCWIARMRSSARRIATVHCVSQRRIVWSHRRKQTIGALFSWETLSSPSGASINTFPRKTTSIGASPRS
jgi:hypothetical protein